MYYPIKFQKIKKIKSQIIYSETGHGRSSNVPTQISHKNILCIISSNFKKIKIKSYI